MSNFSEEEREGMVLEIIEDMGMWDYEYLLDWSQGILFETLQHMPDDQLFEMYNLLIKNQTFH